MEISKTISLCLEYNRSNSKENTFTAYEMILFKFWRVCDGRKLEELNSDEVLVFLNRVTAGRKHRTKRNCYTHLSAFFNFVRNNIDDSFQNPCDNPTMKKFY